MGSRATCEFPGVTYKEIAYPAILLRSLCPAGLYRKTEKRKLPEAPGGIGSKGEMLCPPAAATFNGSFHMLLTFDLPEIKFLFRFGVALLLRPALCSGTSSGCCRFNLRFFQICASPFLKDDDNGGVGGRIPCGVTGGFLSSLQMWGRRCADRFK